MIEIHYRGTQPLHVVADPEGLAKLRASYLNDDQAVAINVWHGLPIFPPGICDCPEDAPTVPPQPVDPILGPYVWKPLVIDGAREGE